MWIISSTSAATSTEWMRGRLLIDYRYINICSLRWNKTKFLSILLYGCTTWMLTKRIKKWLHRNYTRILRAVFNKFWKQHSTKQQLYSHLPPISPTIQVRQARHAGHCLKSKDKLIMDYYTVTHQCWLTCKDLHTSALCGHKMLSRRLTKSIKQ